jgi:hypothetical protein
MSKTTIEFTPEELAFIRFSLQEHRRVFVMTSDERILSVSLDNRLALAAEKAGWKPTYVEAS